MRISELTVVFLPGTEIEEAVLESIQLAKLYHCDVLLNFNDTKVKINEYCGQKGSVEEWYAKYTKGSRA